MKVKRMELVNKRKAVWIEKRKWEWIVGERKVVCPAGRYMVLNFEHHVPLWIVEEKRAQGKEFPEHVDYLLERIQQIVNASQNRSLSRFIKRFRKKFRPRCVTGPKEILQSPWLYL